MNNGTYVAVKFDSATKELIKKLIVDHKIPNAIDPESLHSTLIYSDVSVDEDVTKIINWATGYNLKLEVWKQETSNVLIVKYESEYMNNRHDELREEYNFTHGFDNFIPHFTLSYDCEDFDIGRINLDQYISSVVISSEYQEALDTSK